MLPAPNDYYRTSSSGCQPLRVGLLLDSEETIPAFVAAIIQEINSTNFARVELVVAAGVMSDGTKNSWLYDLYLKKLDARMRPERDPLAQIEGRSLLAGIEVVRVVAEGARKFTAEAVEKIKSKELDVLLLFEFEKFSGAILQAARYGLWALRHGDPDFYSGDPPLFWELHDRCSLSGVALQVLRDEAAGSPVIEKSLFATEQTL